MKRRLALVLLASSAIAIGSCAEEADYVRVVVRSSEPNLGPSLDMRVLLSGGERRSEFAYTAQRTRPAPDLTDFTVTFGESTGEVDIRALTCPNGCITDWGGNVRVKLPGGGRTIPLELHVGEQTVLRGIAPLDGDTDSVAVYGAQVALAWPTRTGKVSTVPVNEEEDRVAGGVDLAPQLGISVRKVRVTSRPSASFSSELFVTSWIEEGLRPTIRVESRNEAKAAPKPVIDLPGITDYHVAVDPSRKARLPIVSAALSDNRVVVYGHDTAGTRTTEPITSAGLTPVTGLVGIVVTPNDTLSLVVKGNTSRLVQISLASNPAPVVAEQRLTGTPVAVSLNADGSRILVASVSDLGDPEKGTLVLQSFSAVSPSPTTPEPVPIARFPFTAGDPASGVALSSCAIAWPERRADGSKLTDVWYSQIDLEQKPAGTPRLAHVSQDGHHWAPSLACFSATRIVATMFAGDNPRGDSANLTIRRLPTR